MKKVVAVLMGLIMVLSLFSCRIKNQKREEPVTTNDQRDEESITTNDTPPASIDIAMQMYEAVLNCDIMVYDTILEQFVYLKDCKTPYHQISLDELDSLKYAYTDMDSDSINELFIDCGDTLILRYYEGTVSTGVVKITMDLDRDISNYHVVIVEDIIDTGRTLGDIVKLLQARNPLSLSVVTLLDKPSRRLVEFEADLALFTIPDHFVIGYGLDCGEYFRNLPYIAEYAE